MNNIIIKIKDNIVGIIISNIIGYLSYNVYRKVKQLIELNQRIKILKFVYTPSECQIIQKDKKPFCIQGFAKCNNAAYLMYKQTVNNHTQLYVCPSINIVDIANPKFYIEATLPIQTVVFHPDSINYQNEQHYQHISELQVGAVKKMFCFIKNGFRWKKIDETSEGIKELHYLTYLGYFITKGKKKGTLSIQEIAKNPENLYKSLQKKINQSKWSIFILCTSLIATLFFYHKLTQMEKQPTLPPFQSNSEDDICVICQNQPKSVLIQPCLHLILCQLCAEEVKNRDNQCPFCRKPISAFKQIFKSIN